ncbi:uncharacterized protein [Acropora muricata]|uniref:uncharacterized protein isoform X2 n=1 Tax=Acropora muricata TaxID=159855 RepID=UPI0034E3E791
MGHFYGSHLALLWAMLLLTVGGNITWLEPPPYETVKDASSISRTNKTVIQGSLNEELSCNFSLTADMSITLVSVKFRGQPAVTLVPNQSPLVETGFAKQFNAVWAPNKLTLILFNVTDAEEGQYCFEVITKGSSARTWIRKIQLLVLDPSQVIGSSITASLDPIPTTDSSVPTSKDVILTTESSITASEDSIPTTDSFVRTSEVDKPRTNIGLGVGGAVFFIVIVITAVCFRKRGKCCKSDLFPLVKPLQQGFH